MGTQTVRLVPDVSGGSFSQGLGEWIGSAEVYDGNGRFAGMGRDTRTVQATDPAGLITVEVTFEGPFSLSGMYTIADHGTHRTYEGPLNLGRAEVLGDGLVAAHNYWPSLGLSQRFFLMVLPGGDPPAVAGTAEPGRPAPLDRRGRVPAPGPGLASPRLPGGAHRPRGGERRPVGGAWSPAAAETGPMVGPAAPPRRRPGPVRHGRLLRDARPAPTAIRRPAPRRRPANEVQLSGLDFAPDASLACTGVRRLDGMDPGRRLRRQLRP